MQICYLTVLTFLFFSDRWQEPLIALNIVWSKQTDHVTFTFNIKASFSAMNNFIQNFQNKSVISVLTCIKRYLQTQFKFNSENVAIFLKSGNSSWILQYAYLSGCSDVISVGSDLVFWI